MKKLFLSLILVMVSLLLGSVAFAAEDGTPDVVVKAKPVVATLYVTRFNATFTPEVNKMLKDRLNAKLSMYDIQMLTKYFDKFRAAGIADVAKAEREDIVRALHDTDVDYVIYAEVQYPVVKQWSSLFNVGFTATMTVPFKIIDIKNDQYIYNAKFVETADNSTLAGSVNSKGAIIKAIDKVLAKTDILLANGIPAK